MFNPLGRKREEEEEVSRESERAGERSRRRRRAYVAVGGRTLLYVGRQAGRSSSLPFFAPQQQQRQHDDRHIDRGTRPRPRYVGREMPWGECACHRVFISGHGQHPNRDEVKWDLRAAQLAAAHNP